MKSISVSDYLKDPQITQAEVARMLDLSPAAIVKMIATGRAAEVLMQFDTRGNFIKAVESKVVERIYPDPHKAA